MQANENPFLPIRVSTLRGDQKIPFDVYVRVAAKHILYCRKGDSFEGLRLKRLKEKKIKQLFIQPESEPDYRGYLSQNIQMAYAATSGKPIEDRAQIIQGLQQAATEEVMESPADQAHYNAFKDESKRYVEFLLLEDQGLRSILQIENTNQNVAHHGINVATIAVALAQQMGFKDLAQLHLMATGSLLHDLEHSHTHLNVAQPIDKMTSVDLELYKAHPTKGFERIQNTQFYDPLVMKIIRHHHECINGTGFPDGLKESQIEPLVMVASVADSYDRLISFEAEKPKEAIKKLMISRVGLQPLEMIQGLASVLKAKNVV